MYNSDIKFIKELLKEMNMKQYIFEDEYVLSFPNDRKYLGVCRLTVTSIVTSLGYRYGAICGLYNTITAAWSLVNNAKIVMIRIQLDNNNNIAIIFNGLGIINKQNQIANKEGLKYLMKYIKHYNYIMQGDIIKGVRIVLGGNSFSGGETESKLSVSTE